MSVPECALKEELEFALELCKDAGQLAMFHFNRGVQVTKKPDNTPVTIADEQCETQIRNRISSKFPNDALLGEEEGESLQAFKSNRKWIIDPIDGTYNFSRGIPIFSVLLALEIDGEVELGVVYNPSNEEIFYAARGAGAFRNGQSICVSKISEIENSMFLFGGINRILEKGPWNGFTEAIRQSYRQRGLGDYLDFSFVFEGKAEAMIEVGLKPWDFAPMKIIAEEAGGKFTDLRGNPSIYSGHCLVSNGKLHEAYLSLLKLP